jgi:hypothetical protein
VRGVRKDRRLSPDTDARETVAKWRASVERGDPFVWDDIERELADVLYEIEDAVEGDW